VHLYARTVCTFRPHIATAYAEKILLLLHKAPTLQRHGTLWLYHFPEPRQAVIHGPVNDDKTPYTETLSGAGLLCNASRYAIITDEDRTQADVQGTRRTELHHLHFYIPDKFSIMAEQEMHLWEEAMPVAVKQIDKVRSQLTEPQLIFDLDSPLHIHRTSLRQERRTHWHFTGDIILCTISILVFLVLFRSYFVKLVQHCCSTNGTEPKAIKQPPHLTLLSLRKEHMSLEPTTYKGMLLRFIYTAR